MNSNNNSNRLPHSAQCCTFGYFVGFHFRFRCANMHFNFYFFCFFFFFTTPVSRILCVRACNCEPLRLFSPVPQ